MLRILHDTKYDFIKPWLKVEHHPMLFERSEIEAYAEGTLYMQPN